MTQESGCEFCNKRGLPILPLRYAPATAGCGAPHAEPGVDIPMPAAAGQYTRRLLREGYLYVYDEASRQWDDYLVTENGYFFRLPPGTKQTLAMPKEFNCAIEKHRAMASFITIYNSKQARNIWLAFSDARWTDAVRARHEQASYRKLHMRCVNIHAYDSSPDSRHCFAINHVGTHVAEYALNEKVLVSSVGFSLFGVDKRQSHVKNLLAACEQMAPRKSFAIVLDDPVGMAADLAKMPEMSIEYFHKQYDRKRALNTYSHINQIRNTVLLIADREKAENRPQRKKSAEEQKAIIAELKSIGSSIDFFKIPKSETEIPDRIKNFKYEKIEATEHENTKNIKKPKKRDPWKKYSKQFNEAAMNAWKEKYDIEYSNFKKQQILPLAEAHASWMESKSINNYFTCNFDCTEPNSGLSYTKAFHACIAGTQDKPPAFNLYYQWFNSDNSKNLLRRALILNMDNLGVAIEDTVKKHDTDWTSIPLNSLVDILKTATKGTTTPRENAQAAIIEEISAIITKIANNIKKTIHPGILILSVIIEKMIMPVNIIDKKINFYTIMARHIIRENLKLAQISTTEEQVRRMTSEQIAQLKTAVDSLEQLEKRHFLIMVDHDQIKSMPKNLNHEGQALWVKKNITTAAQLENIDTSCWREKTKSIPATKKDFLIKTWGWVSFALQCALIQQLMKDQENAMRHEALEILWKMNANIIMLIGFLASVAKNILEISIAKTNLFGNKIKTGLRSLYKVSTLASAMIFIYFDHINANKAFTEGNYRLGTLYRMQTSTMLVTMFATPYLSLGWIIILTIAAIAVSMTIELWKDNKIQEWLARCQWGFNTKGRYQDEKTDMAQLKLAING